jgi:hypothetical protein
LRGDGGDVYAGPVEVLQSGGRSRSLSWRNLVSLHPPSDKHLWSVR